MFNTFKPFSDAMVIVNRKENRIFISTPGDCEPERNAVLRVLDEMNKTVGERDGIYFHALRWEALSEKN